MRIFFFFLMMSSAFAECKPISEPLKLTGEKGLVVRLEDKPYRLSGLSFYTKADFDQASSWLFELTQARHGQIRGTDRYGNESATLFHGEEPIAVAFLRVGIAYLSSDTSECLGELKQAQNEAIAAKSGLWGKLLDAKDPLLNEKAGQYTLVRGKVTSARKGKSGVFINFSYDFKTSLSGYIYERDIAKISWQELTGKAIILKGMLTKNPHLQMVIREQSQIIIE